ncbi:hypothetical protein SAMN00777080_3446 [Aquiflexum balticum DSM 16537]|uniref:Uncharacterized protein n=1 Tax=Aquiflexum balticum DSM 16537 TaxID=758820 RepID=A0A1W2H844_9BACT|nr:hypothetical protein [Aquiflexum balticum]SMD44812.1 hypothetical protein SAMN00777080_3446 [Aquiflexum balticum DSM 16537]
MSLDISKITPVSFMTLILIFFASVAPGILFLFIYDPGIVFELETIKLLVLCFAITAPFWLVNSTVYLILETKFSKGEETGSDPNLLHICSMAGSFWTMPAVYLPSLIALFFELDLKFAVLGMILIEFVTLFLIWQLEHRLRPKKT